MARCLLLMMRTFLLDLCRRSLQGKPPSLPELDTLNGYLSPRRFVVRAAAKGKGFVWASVVDGDPLTLALEQIAGSAAPGPTCQYRLREGGIPLGRSPEPLPPRLGRLRNHAPTDEEAARI